MLNLVFLKSLCCDSNNSLAVPLNIVNAFSQCTGTEASIANTPHATLVRSSFLSVYYFHCPLFPHLSLTD